MSTATAIARPNRAPAALPQRHAPLRVVAPPSRRRPSDGVYRRRRIVAVLALLVLLAVLVQGGRSLLAPATAGEPVQAPVVLVAEPGDSYWSLAAEVHEGGDLRSTVDALVDANGGRALHAGDRIVLAG